MGMPIELKEYGYGKSGIRLVKVTREGQRHHLRDVKVEIQMFGDFEAAYLHGDNRAILPTDTMKNTVYALARQYRFGAIEEFGLRLANHFLGRFPHVKRVVASISEKQWQRISCGAQPHGHAFQGATPERRLALIDKSRSATSIEAGIAGLAVLKTSRSAFNNFLRDEYTTLKETQNRILSTQITAQWSYSGGRPGFNHVWNGVRTALLETFATHDSQSVQHTLCAMGDAVLRSFDCISEIRFSMPNQHCLLVDLSPFHLDNPGEVFLPVDEPSGLIEATVRRPDDAVA